MAVKVDPTPSPHPLPLSAAERGRGPGGRGEVESNIVELLTNYNRQKKGSQIRPRLPGTLPGSGFDSLPVMPYNKMPFTGTIPVALPFIAAWGGRCQAGGGRRLPSKSNTLRVEELDDSVHK